MVINFKVKNQNIQCDKTYTAEKTVNYLGCVFSFSEDWIDFDKTVYFRNTKTNATGERLLVDDVCIIPSAVLADTGRIEVSVWGIKDDVRITTGIAEFFNSKTFKNESVSPEEEITIYEQVLNELRNKVDKVTGKGLSTNDYTDSAKKKVDAIPANPKYTDTVYDDTYVRTEITRLKGDKVDKVTGKGLSTNDYDNASKAKVDAIPADPKYTDTVYDDTEIQGEVTQLKEDIAKKVDKISGKGLSENDYTDIDKTKVDNIPENPKYTDTVYNDEELRAEISGIRNTMLYVDSERYLCLKEEEA